MIFKSRLFTRIKFKAFNRMRSCLRLRTVTSFEFSVAWKRIFFGAKRIKAEESRNWSFRAKPIMTWNYTTRCEDPQFEKILRRKKEKFQIFTNEPFFKIDKIKNRIKPTLGHCYFRSFHSNSCFLVNHRFCVIRTPLAINQLLLKIYEC